MWQNRLEHRESHYSKAIRAHTYDWGGALTKGVSHKKYKEIMPVVIETIGRWNSEIEEHLSHKFDCYCSCEHIKVVDENVYVRVTVKHKYTHYTVGKVIKFHRKSTTTPGLDKLLSRIDTSCSKSNWTPYLSIEC